MKNKVKELDPPLNKLNGKWKIETEQSEIDIHPDLVNSTSKELEELINSFEELDY